MSDGKSLVEKLQGAASIFQWGHFLFSDQPFSAFTAAGGAYPENLREHLTSILQTANSMGFGTGLGKEVADSAIDALTSDDLMKILYDEQRTTADGKRADPVIALENFETMMKTQPKLMAVLMNNAIGVFQAQIGNLHLDQALGVVGMGDLQTALSTFTVNGQKLLDVPLSEINADTVKKFTSEEALSDQKMLSFLDSLPTVRPEGEDGKGAVTKGDIIDEIFKGAAKESGVDETELREAMGKASTDFNNIETLIDRLVQVIDEKTTTFSDDQPEFKEDILNGIREKIPGRIAGIITSKRDELSGDEGQIKIRKMLGELGDTKEGIEQIHGFLKTALNDPATRQTISDIVSTNLDDIKRKMKDAGLDIITLLQLVPDGQYDEELSEGIRDMIKQSGFFEPIAGILRSFMEFIKPFVAQFAPGLYEKLSSQPQPETDTPQQDGASGSFSEALKAQGQQEAEAAAGAAADTGQIRSGPKSGG